MKLKHSEYRKSDSFRYGSIEGTGGIPLKKYDVTALGEIFVLILPLPENQMPECGCLNRIREEHRPMC